MKNKDFTFYDDNRRYSFRTAGVLIHQDKLLIQRGMDGTEYALPGGAVAFGETSTEALVREFFEEIGVEVHVDRLIWIEEVFCKRKDDDCHSICHDHPAALQNPSSITGLQRFTSPETEESRLIFK